MSAWRASAVVTLGVAGVLTFGTGVALGYYNASITAEPVTATVAGGTVELTATGVAGAPLWPGGPAADVTLTVRNPFSQPITVDRLDAVGSGCASPDLRVTPPAGLPLTVPGSGTATATLRGVVAMGPDASPDCQGVDLAVAYTVGATL